jgi:hypothetical protein
MAGSARIAILYVLGTLEDPEPGTHEGFLHTVTAVADDCHDFRTPASQAVLSTYLNDLHPRC